MLTLLVGPTTICCAHFLTNLPVGHKCRRLHGHNYGVTIWLEGGDNGNGMLVEKSLLTSILDKMDHRTILVDNDSLDMHIEKETEVIVKDTQKRYVFPIEDCFFLPLRYTDTTAENLSDYLCNAILDTFFNLSQVQVNVEETDKLIATTTLTREGLDDRHS